MSVKLTIKTGVNTHYLYFNTLQRIVLYNTTQFYVSDELLFDYIIHDIIKTSLDAQHKILATSDITMFVGKDDTGYLFSDQIPLPNQLHESDVLNHTLYYSDIVQRMKRFMRMSFSIKLVD